MTTDLKVPQTRAEVIKAIKAALERRSGMKWSVTGGRGTAYGWIKIDAPPKEKTWHHRDTGQEDHRGRTIYEDYEDATKSYGYMSPARRKLLGELLGLDNPVHCQGESIPSSGDYYREYLDRAETGRAEHNGKPYWD